MADRRRSTRYVVPEAAEASLLIMQDVYVERLAEREIVVLADASVPPGAELLLEISGTFDTRRIATVVVTAGPSRRPGSQSHRLTLRVADGDARIASEFRQPTPSIGVILRRVPVRVRDISAGGCLLEAVNAIPDGAIGVLELTFGGAQHRETLRVCRSASAAGTAWPARSGARFLALSAPPSTSVRNVVARFELMDELGAMPEAMARVHQRGTSTTAVRDAVSWPDAIATRASGPDGSRRAPALPSVALTPDSLDR